MGEGESTQLKVVSRNNIKVNTSNKSNNKFLNKYLKYKNKYLNSKSKIGGDAHPQWTNNMAEEKYNDLKKYIGEPNSISLQVGTNNVNSVTWQKPLNENNVGAFHNLDYIKISNYSPTKLHPKKAPVFVIAGKYMEVPDHLLGPLKYASETINIEQLFVPKESNDNFIQTNGEKTLALVTGSCGSVTISAITVAFVEDMIRKHKSTKSNIENLNEPFKTEYDRIILKYLCGRGMEEYAKEWLKPEKFGEKEINVIIKDESCKKIN